MPRQRRPRRFVRLRESAATATLTRLTESTSVGAVAPAGNGRLLVQLISEGWGTSGYYPGDAIEQAGRNRIFPAGTQMFFDHQSLTESVERPEGSLHNLAAVLEEDARWDPVRRSLVSIAKPMPLYRESLKDKDFLEAVGLSIRAGGMAEYGSAEGRDGLIIKEITEATSVDFVTRAGRGGKVLALLESARVRLAESPTEQTRAGLDAAVRHAWSGEDRYAWVRDWDPARTVVWFDTGGPDGGTWEQSYLVSGTDIALIGPRREVKAMTVYQPVSAAAPIDTEAAALGESAAAPPTDVTDGNPPADPPHPSEGAPEMSGTQTGTAPATAAGTAVDAAAAVQIHEAQRGQREAETARDTALREAQAATLRADTAERDLAAMRAVEAARPLATAALDRSDLPSPAQASVMARALGRVPVVESTRTLDATAFNTLVGAEIEAERAYLAALSESAGVGRVSGFGGTSQPVTAGGSATTEFVPGGAPAPVNTQLAEAFANRGLSAKAAELAARGRPV
jgi:hypothetical protein